MTTAYSDEQLDAMEAVFEKQLPRLPNATDLQRLPMVDSISAAGSPLGMLFRLRLETGRFLTLFLNPMVMFYMFSGINECAMTGGWWKAQVSFTSADAAALTAEDSKDAAEVVSLTTASAGELVLLNLMRREGLSQLVGFRKQTAIDVFLIIKSAAERFNLWDKDFNLLAAEKSQRITDEEIWRAANQLVQRFEDPKLEAAQRADAAYAGGDMFNFDLWTRISTAVKQLLQPPPSRAN